MCVLSSVMVTHFLNEASLFLVFDDVIIDGQEFWCLLSLLTKVIVLFLQMLKLEGK